MQVCKIHKHTSTSLDILYIDILALVCYNINRTKESEVRQMPPFPNEYDSDNTDAAELAENIAEMLREINY